MQAQTPGDDALPELSVAQIEQQLNLAVDRVMTEGGIADRELAALALNRPAAITAEAIFLLRAYRTTLAKLAVSEPVEYGGNAIKAPYFCGVQRYSWRPAAWSDLITPIACWTSLCWRTVNTATQRL